MLLGWCVGESHLECRPRIRACQQFAVPTIRRNRVRDSLVAKASDARKDRPKERPVNRNGHQFFPFASAPTNTAAFELPVELNIVFEAERQQFVNHAGDPARGIVEDSLEHPGEM